MTNSGRSARRSRIARFASICASVVALSVAFVTSPADSVSPGVEVHSGR